MTGSRLSFVFPLAAGGAAGLPLATALAHGVSAGAQSNAMALLVFPAGIVIFIVFMIAMHRRKS